MFQTPLLRLHQEHGGTLATWFGCTLPDRFSHLETEYRAARDTVALLDTNYHAFADFTGPDRIRYLNAMVTSNIRDLREGHGTLGLLLNPQGHILAEMTCYGLADRLLVATHSSARPSAFTTLEKFIIMDDVTLKDTSDLLASLALEGPAVPQMLYEMCGLKLDAMELLSHREVVIGSIACRAVRSSLAGGIAAELLLERAQLEPLWRILLDAVRARDGTAVGFAAFNVLRLEAGVPWFGYDFDDKVIPHEAGLERSHISYVKGCYTGQEIVERVRSRGQVNRLRMGLKFSGLEAPPQGSPLTADGTEVGRVTSAAFSPALQCPIGMGYVRREYTALGTQLHWSGGTAEVLTLPLQEAAELGGA
jgi:folate-binding protein YgfZ